MSNSSLAKKLKKKREELATRSGANNVIYLKEGTKRVRILPVEGAEDLAAEVTHFYLGEKIKGIYSPLAIGKPCPITEAYQDLKDNADEDDADTVKKLAPKKAYLVPVIMYEDEKGKKLDTENSGKLMKISQTVYQAIIDLYLDEDEWGDMTDPKKGYDIKITRTGKGKNNTEYTVMPCKSTPVPKDWAKKKVDLKEMIKAIVPSYEEAQSKLNEFLGISDEDKPKKKNKKSGDDFSTKKSKLSSKKKKKSTGEKTSTKKKVKKSSKK